MKRVPSVLLGVLLAAWCPTVPPAGAAASEDVPMPPALSWKFSSVSADPVAPLPQRNNPAGAVVAGDAVYFCGRGISAGNVAVTSVYAVSLQTGEKLWEQPLEGVVLGSPAVADGTLWVGDSKGYLYAFDVNQGGRERSRFQLSRGTRGAPVVVDGTVYIGDDGGRLFAIDTKTEQVRWQFQKGGLTGWPIEAPVAVSPAHKLVFVCGGDQRVYALRAESGTEYWSRSMPETLLRVAPVVWGEHLYVASGKRVYRLTIRKGEMTRWAADGTDLIVGMTLVPDPSGTGARLYFTCRDGTIHGVNAASGALVWRAPLLLDRSTRTMPVLTQSALLVGTEGGLLYALNPANGRLIWKYRATPPADIRAQKASVSVSAPPVAAGGRLLLLADEGTLFCLGPDGVDTTPPLLTEMEPQGSTPVYGRAPVQIRAVLLEEGSGVQESKIVLKVDGEVVRHRYNAGTGEVTYVTPAVQPLRTLKDGTHTVSLKVADWKGNETEHKWVFLVDNRRVPVAPQPGAGTPGAPAGPEDPEMPPPGPFPGGMGGF